MDQSVAMPKDIIVNPQLGGKNWTAISIGSSKWSGNPMLDVFYSFAVPQRAGITFELCLYGKKIVISKQQSSIIQCLIQDLSKVLQYGERETWCKRLDEGMASIFNLEW
jgi:hypothetical protein